MDFHTYILELRRFMAEGSLLSPQAHAAEFDRLALILYGLQLGSNAVLRQFAEYRQSTHVGGWDEIPAIPTSAFKEQSVTCLAPGDRVGWFQSSGTTTERKSRNFHSAVSLQVYEESLIHGFNPAFGSRAFNRFVALTPRASDAPHSSLAHMFDRLARGSQSSSFVGRADEDGAWEVDIDAAVLALRAAEQSGEVTLVMGTAFNYVHLMDACEERRVRFELPAGSEILQTGGYKGRSRVISQTEFFNSLRSLFGIARIRTEYGMSELSSQAYDVGITNEGAPLLRFPPWARTRIVRPGTNRQAAKGEPGILQIVDLANVASAVAIETGDIAHAAEDGAFVLHGRAEQAEPRGCSLQSAELPA